MVETKYFELSYDELDSKVEQLYKKIESDSFIPDTMLAVARGGWFGARILSDIYSSLEISVDVTSVTTKFYTSIGETSKRPVLMQELSQSLFDQKVLIVDDVSDSGLTLKFIKGYVNWLGARYTKTACVFMKPKTTIIPDYFVEEVPNDTWIVFPYEVRETKRLRENQINSSDC
jgi:hypoxanthine phosphoribosyltransferase